MIKELTSFPKRARTIDWEDGKLIFDGDKVMLMPELSVEVMQQIGAYPALVGFHVKHYPLTDELVQPLAGAKKMVNIGIEYAELTDACFAVFATMPALEYLLLAGNPAITGKGLSMMQASKVALLDLSATSLDDEALHRAAQLPKLNHLHVRQTQITYEGVLGIAFNKRLSLCPGDLFTQEQMELFASLQRNQAKKKLEVDADAVHQAEQVLYAFFAAMTQWEKYTDQAGFDAPDVRPKLQQIWLQYVSEKPRMGYRPLALSLSPEETYTAFRLVDAEQVSRNKLYIYAQDERINLDYRFCMKRVGEAWKIDAVQMRTDGWRRCGL